MKNQKITICNTTIHPGEVANLALPLPEIYACSPLYMPIKVINGEKKGPCLVIFSVLNGTELNGLEIANRIIKSIKPSQISGTIIAIPVLNVYGLTHYPDKLPTGKELKKCFPGNENGSYGERIAHLFTHEILKKADLCIELETGDLNHNILPQVYCNFDNKEATKLAKVFKSPVVTNVHLNIHSLRETTEELQIPLLVYQAGEAMRFDENAISLGVEGIKNVMRAIDMLQKEPTKEVNPIFSRDEDWILSHKAGILHTTVALGQIIEKNEVIGTISDPFGADVIEPIKSGQKGIVVGVNTSPLIYEGMQIFKIASFLNYEKAENVIEEWDKIQPDSYIN
ncbi:MAG: succinylglutamate desuccinylase/aspartoacylase family protein [Legionellaceae bacterium]|nr:succinylglutamate desuccinylase/aspartoacylase family protein [Legionellaceae bacterium]